MVGEEGRLEGTVCIYVGVMRYSEGRRIMCVAREEWEEKKNKVEND